MADSKPYGNVRYADPGYQSDGKARYPIDTEEHVRAAWSYIHQADNASQYTAEQLHEIKSRIMAAGKRLGITMHDDSMMSGRSEIPMTYERIWDLDDIGIVSRGRGGDGRTVEAYAAVFNVRKEIHDRHGDYYEENDPTMYNRTIKNGAVKRALVLYNHGYDARGKSGGLPTVPIAVPKSIEADRKGLLTVARYNEGEFGDAVLESIRNGAIKAYSYEGPIYRSDPMRSPGRARPGQRLPVVRRLEMGLKNFGPTPIPYYEEAEITAVRSVADLAEDFARLDEAGRDELIRTLSATPGWDPETAAILATPRRGPGAEDPRIAHSVRQSDISRRIRVGMTMRGISS